MKERNFAGVRFEDLRVRLDPIFNEVHDKLSECYYKKLPFSHEGREYGILDKPTFDELHGLLWKWYEVEFHRQNMKRTLPYAEEEYNEVTVGDEKVERHKVALLYIAEKKAKGLELTIKIPKGFKAD